MSNTLITQLYECVVPFYKEPHRVFHNVNHLNIGFYLLQRLQRDGYDINEVHFAAWCFHDSVYVIGANDNELRSADLFERFNKEHDFGFSDSEVQTVRTIIIDTIKHFPTIEESKIVLDIDMLILGSNYNSFVKYREDIANEYASKFTKEEIKQGTIQFLNNLLKQQEPIFKTEVFSKYEGQVKENINLYKKEFLL